MTNKFRSYNVIYIVYGRKNENHWSISHALFITRNTNTRLYAISLVHLITSVLLIAGSYRRMWLHGHKVCP